MKVENTAELNVLKEKCSINLFLIWITPEKSNNPEIEGYYLWNGQDYIAVKSNGFVSDLENN